MKTYINIFIESTSERRTGEVTDKRLKEQILYNYDPEVRPVRNSSTCVMVKLKCILLQIADVVSKLVNDES